MLHEGKSFPLLDAMQVRVLIFLFFSADVALVTFYLVFTLVGNPLGNDSPVLFDLNGEGNIPAWYSAMKLFTVAICAYFYGRLVLLEDKFAGWLILLGAAGFAYLSMDEGSTLHEKIGDRFNMLVSGTGELTAKPIFETTGLWMVFLGPPLFIALVGGVIYLRKRLSIPNHVFVKALAGITIFVVAAAPGDIAYNYVSGNARILQIAIEEFSEMIGVSLILWAVMALIVGKQAAVVANARLEPAREPTARAAAAPAQTVRRAPAGAAPAAAGLHRNPS